MAGAITPGAIAFVRTHWPTAEISGSGDRWAVLRPSHSLRHDQVHVVFFPTKAEALVEGAKSGDRIIEARCPVPKITRELGYERDRDDERWERRMKVDGL